MGEKTAVAAPVTFRPKFKAPYFFSNVLMNSRKELKKIRYGESGCDV